MSQIKTATKAEQQHEAEMKVRLRDVSVDKPFFPLLVLLVVIFLEKRKPRSTLSFSVAPPSIFLTSFFFGLFQVVERYLEAFTLSTNWEPA